MAQNTYQIFGVNSIFIWVDYFEGTPSELLKETFNEKINYSIKILVSVCPKMN